MGKDMTNKTEKGVSFSDLMQRIHPVRRMVISLLIATAGFFLLKNTGLSFLVLTLFAWCIFALTYLIISWVIIFSRSIPNIKKIARVDDGSGLFVAFIILLSSFASMISVLFLVIDKNKDTHQMITVPLIITGIFLSWVLVHTTFSFHYAHEYYDNDSTDENKDKQGLNFPGEEDPDYPDFTYFSFVVGMTFQVSDVEVTSKKMRRLVLMHGLISFALNTFVVALTINLIAGLSK